MGEFRAWCVPGVEEEGGVGRPSGGGASGAGGAVVEAGAGGGGALRLRCLELDAPAMGRIVARLRGARRGLLERPVDEIAQRLGRVGLRFLDGGDPVRARALELLPPGVGISGPMAVAIVDGMAADWTPERLLGLLRAEFGDPAVLDRLVDRNGGGGTVPARPGGSERGARSMGARAGSPGAGRIRALGAALAVHLSSGTVPGVSVTSLVRSLLVKSPVLLKPGRGDVVLPVLFLEALAAEDPELAAAAAVIYWPGGEGEAEAAALEAADLVVVYGSDGVVAAVRRRLGPHVPMVAYHHRVSAALVGREALRPGPLEAAARQAARAVALFDQRGCVSPRVVWVEEGGEVGPRDFARALTRALARLEEELPSGVLNDVEASALQQLRGTAELREAAGEDFAVWAGGDAPWTVVYEGGPGVEGGAAGGRLVRVRGVPDALDLGDRLAPLAPHLQTVAVCGLGGRIDAVAEHLARAGAGRIASLDGAPWPPPWWHHDGRGPLQALVRWVDVEEGAGGGR
ncbi:MAG TPA: acyl-CoA reductase [Longimicrobiales bacterium]|nr:acyl-CoA reductase [Longimicrobiales bacterium]